MGRIGTPELIIILVIVLLIFGAGRVTGVFRELGAGIREFRRGLNEDEEPADEAENNA